MAENWPPCKARPGRGRRPRSEQLATTDSGGYFTAGRKGDALPVPASFSCDPGDPGIRGNINLAAISHSDHFPSIGRGRNRLPVRRDTALRPGDARVGRDVNEAARDDCNYFTSVRGHSDSQKGLARGNHQQMMAERISAWDLQSGQG